MDYLEAEPLTVNNHLYMYPENKEITLKIPKQLEDEIREVLSQLAEYNPDDGKVSNEWENWNSFIIHLDNHLYSPLIIWQKGKEDIKSIPVKLNQGEQKFVKDLKIYIQKHTDKFEKNDIFLLRNLARKGIGFFITSGFYPDFILWIKEKNKQQIIFIDPKGIRTLGNFNDDKIQFCTKYIKEIEERIQQHLKTLYLDAFIISVSKYSEIKRVFGEGNHTKEDFELHKVLFQEDSDYIVKIFTPLL